MKGSPRLTKITRLLPAVLVAGALAVTAPADAAPTGVTTSVYGLGRAVELDLVARTRTGLVVVERGTDLSQSTPVAYGIGANAQQTTDLTTRGLASRAWQRAGDATSAVVNTRTGLVVAGEPGLSTQGTTVGAVYRRYDETNVATVRSASTSTDPTVVESNLGAGGSVWGWTYRGMQYINDFGYGRQIQTSLFVRRPGSTAFYDYNPTEGGDEWGNRLLHPELRHGSPVASVTTTGTQQSTRAIPLEWSPLRISPDGQAWTPVLYPDVRLGKDLVLDVDGMSGVARYRTVVTVPSSLNGSLEIPSAYLRGNFDTYYGVDAVAGTIVPIQTEEYDPLTPQRTDGTNWVPASGIGGVVASTSDGQHAMGIYGRTATAGGRVTTFNVHDFVPSELWQTVAGFGEGQYDFSSSKLRAMYTGTFPAGTSTFDTYIVTGTRDEVVARMQALRARNR